MTFSAFLGLAGTLVVLVGLMFLGARLLKSYLGHTLGGSGTLRVLHRLTLGPRQGIAVVRLTETRTLVVSVGEGGVRALTELAPDERDALVADAAHERPTPATAALKPFADLMQQAFARSGRGAGVLLLAVTLAATGGQPARAQGAPRPPTALQQPVTGPAPARPLARQQPPRDGQLTGTATSIQTAPSGAVARADQQTQAPGAAAATADQAIGRLAPSIDLRVGQATGGLRLSGTVGVVIMMGLLTLLPSLVLMMTGFTRILIVLHFLKQAMGTPQAPPPQLLAALALIVTGFVMTPTLSEMNREAVTPWMDGRIEQVEMMRRASVPLRDFMLRQVRDQDLETFVALAHLPDATTEADVPLVVVTAAFVTSELKTAFQIGFLIFLPFIIIDLVVASVLMSMGMFMVPPAMIALPFKLLLFVLVDGWTLVITGLAQSFH